MSKLPTAIGKYRIERELGKGATGTVYLAYDAFRNLHVAVKQIHPHLMAEPAQAARHRRMLHNEAVLAGQLQHPHLVAVIDIDEQANPPYLVLEYVQGRSLEAFTAPDTLLPVSQVLDIAFKCCNALEYAQTRGLVHRDIKPANLLLQENGEVKLTDFGTALSLLGDKTHMLGLIGSPAYMAPEQIKEEPVTHHADMFSLAVVIYELLCGHKPFQGESDYATMYKISSEPPVSLRVKRPELPGALDAVVAKALAKKALDRYPTWRDFSDALIGVNRSLPRQASQSTEAELFAELRAMHFFAGFPDVALWQTLRLGKRHMLPRGALLMKEDTLGQSFYLLIEGKVTVTRKDWELNTLSAGVSIGEMVYLQPERNKRTATVVAATDIVVMKIQSASLREAPAELQGLFDKAFIRLLVARLIATNRQLAEWDLAVPMAKR